MPVGQPNAMEAQNGAEVSSFYFVRLESLYSSQSDRSFFR